MCSGGRCCCGRMRHHPGWQGRQIRRSGQLLQGQKDAAHLHQRGQCLGATDHHHDTLGRAEAGDQRGIVAIAGDDAETIDSPAVQQIHRINRQQDVGGVLAGRGGLVMDRLDGVACDRLKPAARARRRPVGVHAAHANGAKLTRLGQHMGRDAGRAILPVDEQGHRWRCRTRRCQPRCRTFRRATLRAVEQFNRRLARREIRRLTECPQHDLIRRRNPARKPALVWIHR